MKYLITGGSGFIGTNLVKKLLEDRKNSITILDIKKPSFHEDLKCWCFDWADLDIVYDDIGEVFIDKDVVIHLACQPGVEFSVEYPEDTFFQNTYGTLRCLEAARKFGVKKFVFASSGGTVLGEHFVPLKEDLCPRPASPYGASKLACEGYCRAYNSSYGLDTIILRFSNVYGPFSNHKDFNLIPNFIISAIEDKPCFINGDGTITKDYIFVGDLITAIMKASNSENMGGEIFQIATGKQTSVNEIKDEINILSEKYLNRSLNVSYRDERIGDVRYSCDVSKASRYLRFDYEYSLKKGLRKSFKWYMKYWNR